LAAPLYFAKEKRESLFYVEIEYATYQIEYQESLKQVKINGCWGIRNGLKKTLLILKIYCGMFKITYVIY
jgi:hypothetical protein